MQNATDAAITKDQNAATTTTIPAENSINNTSPKAAALLDDNTNNYNKGSVMEISTTSELVKEEEEEDSAGAAAMDIDWDEAKGDGSGSGGSSSAAGASSDHPPVAPPPANDNVSATAAENDKAKETSSEDEEIDDEEDSSVENGGPSGSAAAPAQFEDAKDDDDDDDGENADVQMKDPTPVPAGNSTKIDDEEDNQATTMQSGTTGDEKAKPLTDQPSAASGDIYNADENGESETVERKTKSPNGSNGVKKEPPASTTESTTTPSIKTEPYPPAATPASAPATSTAPPAPNLPTLRGVLFYNEEERTHHINGNWNYENAIGQSQPFRLSRNLADGEDLKKLTVDAEFSGTFTLMWITSSKGKIKERTRSVADKSVKISFSEIKPEDGAEIKDESNKKFKISGTGSNEFGIFDIDGTAEPSGHGDGQYRVVMTKSYVVSTMVAVQSEKKKNKKKKKSIGSVDLDGPDEEDSEYLPDPSPTYDEVVVLRGKMTKLQPDHLLGATSVETRISGFWANSMELLLLDPQNVQGRFPLFELSHKGDSSSGTFAVNGRYSGYFYVETPDRKQHQVVEKDVTLRFRENNKGFHNVEGKGSNAYGKYTISGTLTDDGVLTIFRHFAPAKKKEKHVTSAPPPINEPGQRRRPSVPIIVEKKFSLDDVKVPENDGSLEPMEIPANGMYSAVSRGVLRVNDDGSHGCQGKWAMAREHFDTKSTLTNGFKVRLEPHYVEEALKRDPSRTFPVDSDMYKGSFQMRKGTRQTTIVDTQVVMKFRQTSQGSFNVYGKGCNSIGVFNLIGKLVMNGITGGHIELYRTYPPELLIPQAGSDPSPVTGIFGNASKAPLQSLSGAFPSAPRSGGLVRRESSRMVKLPSRLEDDDPDALMSRLMDRCNQVLRKLRAEDLKQGGFFAAPVDPKALNIPNYPIIIKEPMDLSTLQKKMESGEVKNPEEFARLARLIFNNAMTFNVDATHVVHIAARNLLTSFNLTFESVEQQLTSLRKANAENRNLSKADKKRKRGEEEMKSPKRRRLDEAKEMAVANAAAMSNLMSNAGATLEVTRTEFNMALQMISTLQHQVVQTFNLIADLSSDVPTSSTSGGSSSLAEYSEISAPAGGKKKARKKQETVKAVDKPALVEDDSTPLTMEEQEFLTSTIPEMDNDKLEGVIKIIRESSTIGADDDEIDLEIDSLDTVTQRKLLKFVLKFRKPAKARKPRGQKKERAAGAQAKAYSTKKAPLAASPLAVAPIAAAASKSAPQLFNYEGTDSESEGEISEDEPQEKGSAPSAHQPVSASKGFRLQTDDDDSDDDDGGDDDDTDGNDIPSWNITNVESADKKRDGDEDGAWGAAREEALAAKAREEDKKKRAEKLKAEAEQQKSQRLAEAVAHGEEIKAQRQAEEEEEVRLREEQELEAEEERKKARENARKQVQSVEQTVDLDDQRDLMKQLEQNYMDTEMGGASPSSDFGF